MRGLDPTVPRGGINVIARDCLRMGNRVGEFPSALLDPPEADGAAPLVSGLVPDRPEDGRAGPGHGAQNRHLRVVRP
jgi:hypothetical protein